MWIFDYTILVYVIVTLIVLIGEKSFPLVWEPFEVIEALETFDIPVVSLTSDDARPNRRFYYMCQRERCSGIPFKTFNPYRKDANLYVFCDVPHLLKRHVQSSSRFLYCIGTPKLIKCFPYWALSNRRKFGLISNFDTFMYLWYEGCCCGTDLAW